MAESKNGGTEAAGTNATLSKVDAVAQALAELGKDASRADIQKFVKDHHGYQMSLDHISNCKGELAKRGGQSIGKKPAPKKPQQAGHPAPTQQRPEQAEPKPAATANGKAAAIPLDDILAVRSLVDRVGADNLRTLIGAFER